MELTKIYQKLLDKYGKQAWWPISNPKASEEEKKFEIIIGAILAQNTTWKNVEKALTNLKNVGFFDAKKIIESKEKIAELIKPSGYYNQKAETLKIIADFYLKEKNPTREQLLSLKGIGKETADSILLYAYQKPFFIIDAYTKRMFICLMKKENKNMKGHDYDEWQDFFHFNLEKNLEMFKEFHALIVKHCKNVCVKKKDRCKDCFL